MKTSLGTNEDSSTPSETTNVSDLTKAIVTRLVQVVMSTCLFFGAAFAGAGTLAWNRAWICFAVSMLCLVVNGAVVIPRNPQVIAERGRLHKGTKPFDKAFMAIFAPAMLSVYFVAGLDAVRFQSAALPLWTLGPGLFLTVTGNLVTMWAMLVNPHLEQSVRIQQERAHRVVATGPYRLVRHPMYASMFASIPGMALALGSAWALAPVFVCLAAITVRAALEDKTLRAELAGYEEYTQKTRYRLIPGLW